MPRPKTLTVSQTVCMGMKHDTQKMSLDSTGVILLRALHSMDNDCVNQVCVESTLPTATFDWTDRLNNTSRSFHRARGTLVLESFLLIVNVPLDVNVFIYVKGRLCLCFVRLCPV